MSFWDQKPATNSGVLDGFSEVHKPDIKQSLRLIENQSHKFAYFNDALDLGGGNGRVVKEVLLKKFKNVDLADFSTKQIAGAKKNVPQVRKFINQGI